MAFLNTSSHPVLKHWVFGLCEQNAGKCLSLSLKSPENSLGHLTPIHFDSPFKMRYSKYMFLLQTAKNVSSWHPSVISGDDGRVPGVVLLSPYYYSCRVFGIWSEKQTPIAPSLTNQMVDGPCCQLTKAERESSPWKRGSIFSLWDRRDGFPLEPAPVQTGEGMTAERDPQATETR